MAEYKDITILKKQISDFKKSINSPNSDYMTGYLSALSATEGIIAALPTADVVEVVRCRDCKYYETINLNGTNISSCNNSLLGLTHVKPDAYCSYGERRTNNDLL